jgi:DNA-binding GntR family transcriptional regulator
MASAPSPGALRDDVIRVLSDRIITGELPAGTRLNERRISDELGVSRVPVREAIITLAAYHLVTIKLRSSAFVAPQTRHDVAELFDVREALEPLVASLAAQNRTEEDLERLETAQTTGLQAAAGGDFSTGSRANAEFHELLLEAGHNGLLKSLMEPLSLQIRRLFMTTIVGHDVDLLEDHARELEAVRIRDAEWAALLARRHVTRTRERSLALFDDEAG